MTPSCKTCDSPLGSSTKLIPGHTVYRCRVCRLFWFEGDYVVFQPGEGRMGQLQKRALELDAAKIDHEAMTSDSDDPRWVRL